MDGFPQVVGLEWLVLPCKIGLLVYENYAFSKPNQLFESNIVWLPPAACCVIVFLISLRAHWTIDSVGTIHSVA